MNLPEGYIDALSDELSPFGLEYAAVTEDADGSVIRFRVDPRSFVGNFPQLGIEESYGSAWPPDQLELRLRLDGHNDPVQLDFETVDLFAETASVDLALRDRLNTLADPADHAVAVGQAFGLAVAPKPEQLPYWE